MSKWRYIAIDVDGTLLDDQDHFASDRFNKDVQQLDDQGIMLIVASGNSYDALQSIFHSCPAVVNFVAENGGRIIVNGHETLSRPHHRKNIAALLNLITAITPQPDLLSLSGANQTFIAQRYHHVAVPYYPHHTYFTYLSTVNEPIYNLNISWFRHHPSLTWIHQLVVRLNRQFTTIHATYSGTWGIDILPTGVNKADSLKYLIQSRGGTMADLIAFGDTSNDQEMIAAAGCGYAMKNATPDLLAIADRITKFDNNHNGLLTEIESLYNLTH